MCFYENKNMSFAEISKKLYFTKSSWYYQINKNKHFDLLYKRYCKLEDMIKGLRSYSIYLSHSSWYWSHGSALMADWSRELPLFSCCLSPPHRFSMWICCHWLGVRHWFHCILLSLYPLITCWSRNILNMAGKVMAINCFINIGIDHKKFDSV